MSKGLPNTTGTERDQQQNCLDSAGVAHSPRARLHLCTGGPISTRSLFHESIPSLE